jgi:hypothetical protein
MKRLENYIDGKWCDADAIDLLDVTNPATGEVLAAVPLSLAADLERAVVAAATAFRSWRRTPPTERVQSLFKLKILLEEHQEELAQLTTLECGKTLAESKAELQRAIENVEVACGIPSLMQAILASILVWQRRWLFSPLVAGRTAFMAICMDKVPTPWNSLRKPKSLLNGGQRNGLVSFRGGFGTVGCCCEL